jgi:hypothetical protein
MAYGDTGALAVFGSGKALAREPMAVGSRTRNRQAQVDAIWVDCTGSHKVVPYIRNSRRSTRYGHFSSSAAVTLSESSRFR